MIVLLLSKPIFIKYLFNVFYILSETFLVFSSLVLIVCLDVCLPATVTNEFPHCVMNKSLNSKKNNVMSLELKQKI